MLVLYYLRAQKMTWTEEWGLYIIWRSLIQTIQRSVRNKYSLSLDHSHKDRVYADVSQPPLFSIFELWSLGQRPTHTKPCYKKKKKIHISLQLAQTIKQMDFLVQFYKDGVSIFLPYV